MSARLIALQDRLDMYIKAEIAIIEGNQSWQSPDGMVYTRANLSDIQKQIQKLENTIAAIDGSGYTAQTVSFGGRR